jgi:hypothetical protein
MRLMLATVAAAAFACGGSSSGSAPNTFTFGASGVSPTFMMVGTQSTVTFMNSDTVAHGVTSSNCSELAAASIAAGANAVISLGAGPKTCSFADALNASATSFQGSVQIAAPGTPGY